MSSSPVKEELRPLADEVNKEKQRLRVAIEEYHDTRCGKGAGCEFCFERCFNPDFDPTDRCWKPYWIALAREES